MKLLLMKTEKHKSKMDEKGYFYYFFWKDPTTGKSYRSCVYEMFRNFARWQPFIGKEKVLIDNLAIRGNIVDADSNPIEYDSITHIKEVQKCRNIST